MNDELLVQRFREGDTAAFDVLAARYQDRLFRLALGRLHHHEDAEDAVQEILMRAARGLEGFRGQSQFSTWLYRLAHNTCMDCYRRRQRWHSRVVLDPELLMDQATEGPEAGWEQEFSRELVERAMQQLSPGQRELITLRDRQAYSNAEVANALGLDIGTMKARLHRARSALRRHLSLALAQEPVFTFH